MLFFSSSSSSRGEMKKRIDERNFNGKIGFHLLALLKDCAKKKDLYRGCRVHEDISKSGLLQKNPFLATTLISMYAKCGEHLKAEKVLEELLVRDIFSWSALISGYVQTGQADEALDCFERMRREGISPNTVAYTSILKACGSMGSIDKGKEIHREIVNKGLMGKDVMLGTALVDMYVKCGMLTMAQKVLESLPVRDIVSWNALLGGYAQLGLGHKAWDCFQCIQNEGLSPNVVTYACILQSFRSIDDLKKGEEIHEEILEKQLLEKKKDDVVLANALIDMYARCSVLEKAAEVLEEIPVRNRVSWNTLLSGYTEDGQYYKAVACLDQMESEGIYPDGVTYISILKACGCIRDIEKGIEIHGELKRRGMLQADIVLATALLDMYAKCGFTEKAQAMLQELPSRNEVAFNSLMAGYIQQGQCDEALNCFEWMRSEGISPSISSFICMLKACGDTESIDKAEGIYDEIVNNGFLHKDPILGTALVDMYAKCGILLKAQEVLEQLPMQDVVSWNALIAGQALQCQGYEALNTFYSMQRQGICPNKVTFLCVLSACCHSGLWNEAKQILDNMMRSYGIKPNIEHLTCMLVVLGYAGKFDQAMAMIEAMPYFDDPTVWLTLLGACKKWGNVKLGRLAFDQVIQLHTSCATPYVLMAELFWACGMTEDAKYVEGMRTTIHKE